MGLSIKKLNDRGFSSHLLVPVLVISLIAGMGAYVVSRSNANTAYSNGAIYTGNLLISADGKQQTSYQYKPYGGSAATFSPDGKKIAFIGYSDWANTGPGGQKVINIQNSDGTGNVQVFKSEPLAEPTMVMNQLSWSNDGKWLTFVIGSGENGDDQSIAVLGTSLDSSGVYPYETISLPNQLSTSSMPYKTAIDVSFYPDSQKIGFTTEIDGKPSICWVKMASTENGCIGIAQPSNLAGSFGLSREGNAKILSSGSEAIVNLWSADYSACNQTCPSATNIYKVHLGTGAVTNLTTYDYTSAANLRVGKTIVSPDENKLIFSGYNNSPTAPKSDIYSVDLASKQTTVILSNMSLSSDAAWQSYLSGSTQPKLPFNARYDVSCTVTTSGTPTAGKPLAFSIILKNSSPSVVSLSPKVSYTFSSAINTLGPVDVAPGGSQTITGQTPAITYASQPGQLAEVSVQLAEGYLHCRTPFTLPTSPLTLSQAPTHIIPYKSTTYSITGKTAPNSYVKLSPKYLNGTLINNYSVKSDSLGNFKFNPFLSPLTQDITYSAEANGVKSSVVRVKLRPLVGGATSKTVTRNTNFTISGQYMPGSKVTIHMRKPSDPAGTYPRIITATVNSSGYYSLSVKADTKKVYYVQAANGAKSPLYTVFVK